MRVNATGVGDSPLIQTNTSTAGQATQHLPQNVQIHPMSVLLFGRRPPNKLDRKKRPRLGKAMRKLDDVKDQICDLMRQPGGEIELELAEGNNACITEDGELLIGEELLERHQDNDDLLVAILGHEIGHQPWNWKNLNLEGMTRARIAEVYRQEEARADYFAGLALAELGAKPDALCKFLLSRERFEAKTQSSEYYPADVRASILNTAYAKRRRIVVGGPMVAGIMVRPRDLR